MLPSGQQRPQRSNAKAAPSATAVATSSDDRPCDACCVLRLIFGAYPDQRPTRLRQMTPSTDRALPKDRPRSTGYSCVSLSSLPDQSSVRAGCDPRSTAVTPTCRPTSAKCQLGASSFIREHLEIARRRPHRRRDRQAPHAGEQRSSNSYGSRRPREPPLSFCAPSGGFTAPAAALRASIARAPPASCGRTSSSASRSGSAPNCRSPGPGRRTSGIAAPKAG